MYYYAIILTSLIFAGIYDYRTRYINDLVWIPSVFATLIFMVAIPDLFIQIMTRILFIFVIGYIISYFKFVGQADVIAFLFAFLSVFLSVSKLSKNLCNDILNTFNF